jgi:all-trans-8'-apo-beta-carotenal 15,15'-oxygenase
LNFQPGGMTRLGFQGTFLTDKPALDRAPFLDRVFLFEPIEDSYRIESVCGNLPPWIRGTYYINGPSRFMRGDFRYTHWLDGDGQVCAIRFTDDGVTFANRLVRTSKFMQEESAGVPLYRAFGTAFPGDRLRRGLMLEPPVNVSAYFFAGKLLAFGEQSLPLQMDPITLETGEEYDFGGRLTSVTPFSAHPKFDPDSGNMLNFGVQFSSSQPVLNLYEFSPQGDLIRRRRQPIRLLHSNHDFAITPNYAVFYLSPLLMNFEKFWSEGLSVMDALSWEPSRGSSILVMPRESKSREAFEVMVEPFYCLHLINSFEDENSLLNVDVLELEAPAYPEYRPIPDLFPTVTPCRPTRYIIDLAGRKLVDRIVMNYDRSPDFPTPDRSLVGKKYDDFWMLGISAAGQPGPKFFDQLAHGSWKAGDVRDVFQTNPGQYLGGEPLHVVNPHNPEEAVIINEWIDASEDRVEIVIFDAGNVARGPIARLGLKHKIHPGFHTSFHPER